MVLGYQMLLQNTQQDGGGDASAAGAAAEEAAESASGQNEEDEQQVVKVVDEMLERYFAALRVVADAPSRQEDAVALIQQLEKWHGDVRGLESLLPPVPTLAGAADDIIARILRARVAFTFGNVAAMWRDALVALSLASTAPKTPGCQRWMLPTEKQWRAFRCLGALACCVVSVMACLSALQMGGVEQ